MSLSLGYLKHSVAAAAPDEMLGIFPVAPSYHLNGVGDHKRAVKTHSELPDQVSALDAAFLHGLEKTP